MLALAGQPHMEIVRPQLLQVGIRSDSIPYAQERHMVLTNAITQAPTVASLHTLLCCAFAHPRAQNGPSHGNQQQMSRITRNRCDGHHPSPLSKPVGSLVSIRGVASAQYAPSYWSAIIIPELPPRGSPRHRCARLVMRHLFSWNRTSDEISPANSEVSRRSQTFFSTSRDLLSRYLGP